MKQTGFSLIELMIVVLIIGISSSMAILSIDTNDDRLKSEAKRLFAMIQYARDDAIINGETLGIELQFNNYYFTRFDGSSWQTLSEKPYKIFEGGDDIRLRSLIGGSQKKKNRVTGADEQDIVDFSSSEKLIYFAPTGETSEFQIWISNDEGSEFLLDCSLVGELSLEKVL